MQYGDHSTDNILSADEKPIYFYDKCYILIKFNLNVFALVQ